MGYIFLALGIVSEIIGTLSLKIAIDKPWFYLVVLVGYLISFAAVAKALAYGLPMGLTYGIWAAVGILAVAILSIPLYNETMTITQWIGVGVIVFGVLLLEVGKA